MKPEVSWQLLNLAHIMRSGTAANLPTEVPEYSIERVSRSWTFFLLENVAVRYPLCDFCLCVLLININKLGLTPGWWLYGQKPSQLAKDHNPWYVHSDTWCLPLILSLLLPNLTVPLFHHCPKQVIFCLLIKEAPINLSLVQDWFTVLGCAAVRKTFSKAHNSIFFLSFSFQPPLFRAVVFTGRTTV